MSNNKTLPIALEVAKCNICGKIHQHGGISIGTRFVSEEAANRKEELIAQTPTHYAHCKDCQTLIEKDFVAMIEFDPQLTVDDNPYRTGKLCWLKDFLFQNIFNEDSYKNVIEAKAAFVEPIIFKMMIDLHNSVDNGNDPAENGENIN